MTEELQRQIAESNAMSRELAQAVQSPWEPQCIARAFATPVKGELALTMQRWIDLADIRSPLLQGEIPAEFEEMTAAAEIFGCAIEDLSIHEAGDVARRMLAATDRAFAAQLGMRPRESGVSRDDDGFGGWLPTFACLVTQCELSEVEALALRVDRAFMLIAGHRRNQGWLVSGVPYAMRDEPNSPTTEPAE